MCAPLWTALARRIQVYQNPSWEMLKCVKIWSVVQEYRFSTTLIDSTRSRKHPSLNEDPLKPAKFPILQYITEKQNSTRWSENLMHEIADQKYFMALFSIIKKYKSISPPVLHAWGIRARLSDCSTKYWNVINCVINSPLDHSIVIHQIWRLLIHQNMQSPG